MAVPMLNINDAMNEKSISIKRYYKTVYGPYRKNFKNLVDDNGNHLDFEKIKIDENFNPCYDEGGNLIKI